MRLTFPYPLRLLKMLLSACLIVAFCYLIWNRGSVSAYNTQNIAGFYYIDYPSEYNYKQVSTYCGPFSTAAVVRALQGKKVDSFEYSENIGWRIFNKGTHPIGLSRQLEKQYLNVEIARLRSFSDDERLLFLQERLSQGKAIIILGEKYAYQHYVTLFGFNKQKQEYYIYDSWCPEGTKGLVVDENGSLPGNLTLNSQELLTFWGKGGMYSFYEWYALVASK
ncbi:hypothetical protein [Pontibacter pudoricolor]|uniref:hypothetical protein n=1 Tax=Pontibacter pudoricolor TaxID=2694930 RepID=UPI0013913B26|nr:hypothetical protein [Pontibacter pudoricolor]